MAMMRNFEVMSGKSKVRRNWILPVSWGMALRSMLWIWSSHCWGSSTQACHLERADLIREAVVTLRTVYV